MPLRLMTRISLKWLKILNEEGFWSEQESVVASKSDCDDVELAVGPMIDCDNIGVVDSNFLLVRRLYLLDRKDE
jgi:hypothetical protein